MKKTGFILRLIQAILYTVVAIIFVILCLICCFAIGNKTYDLKSETYVLEECKKSGVFDYEYYTVNEQYSNVIFIPYLRVEDVNKAYLGINVTYTKDNINTSENFTFELYRDDANAKAIWFKNAGNGQIVKLDYEDIAERGFLNFDGNRFATVFCGVIGVLMVIAAALQYIFAFRCEKSTVANMCCIVVNCLFIVIGVVGLIGGIIGLIGLKQNPN